MYLSILDRCFLAEVYDPSQTDLKIDTDSNINNAQKGTTNQNSEQTENKSWGIRSFIKYHSTLRIPKQTIFFKLFPNLCGPEILVLDEISTKSLEISTKAYQELGAIGRIGEQANILFNNRLLSSNSTIDQLSNCIARETIYIKKDIAPNFYAIANSITCVIHELNRNDLSAKELIDLKNDTHGLAIKYLCNCRDYSNNIVWNKKLELMQYIDESRIVGGTIVLSAGAIMLGLIGFINS